MSEIKNLYEIINTQKQGLKNFNPEIFEIPDYISNNLKYSFFDWQREALENFLFYQNPKSNLAKSPTHLMFNMATGTGKTMLMAASILYYYKQGYRHFIFFVNQNNIVSKTENNFIANLHNKYLFQDKIVIDNQTVEIKKVEAFSDNPTGIEIKFTSVQKLYNDIHLQKENQTTLPDLWNKNIVMLADEAHHLNTDTKKAKLQTALLDTELNNKSSENVVEKLGWEHTVIELILNKNNKKSTPLSKDSTPQEGNSNCNVLLEFTATIPATASVAKKYEDKIIYKFDLKQFLQAGFTKQINLISSNLNKRDRILQALLFHWYRHKVALDAGIPNFKPVILFRSKTIEESKQDYEEFFDMIQNLSLDDLQFLDYILENFKFTNHSLYEQGKNRTEQLVDYIQVNKIKRSEIIDFLKQNFQVKNVIITNSKSNKTKKEKTDEEIDNLLNNLEDKNNHIRAIFTVERLTEGWDVLNLYDIVRLYEGQNTGGSNLKVNKTPESTTKEKQLIGRGVRYYPFDYPEKERHRRKFDNDTQKRERILEELFFYSINESRYISELKTELKRDGFIDENRNIRTFELKDSFKKTNFYKQVKVWQNKKIPNPNRRKNTLADLKQDKNYFMSAYQVPTYSVREDGVDFEKEEKEYRLNQMANPNSNFEIPLAKMEKHIFYKAIHILSKQSNSLYRFDNLRQELNIDSMEDLLKAEFLGDIKIPFKLPAKMTYQDLDNKHKLQAVMQVLTDIERRLGESISEYIGSKEFYPKSLESIFGAPKAKAIDTLNEHTEMAEQNDWYVLNNFVGTDQEQYLLEFIKSSMSELEQKYGEIYLLRNEEVYGIYDFDKGRTFMPDFLLFLKTKDKHNVGVSKTELYYQVFIEPKGAQLATLDAWKNDFLAEIQYNYKLENIIQAENSNYRLIGLPFFNTNLSAEFRDKFSELI
jgi:type III restriction enzyme